jgi:uncharacterized membrane protein YfcA
VEFDFNPYYAFGWSLFAGFIMSMGAGGGGILAGIGHISVLGIGDPNMIKVVNQILEAASRVSSVPMYYRQKRLIWPMAITFGIGAPFGAVVGSWTSKNYLADLAMYRIVFGALVALVAARMIYEGWAKGARNNARLQKANAASDRIRKENIDGFNADPSGKVLKSGARTTELRWNRITVDCAGEPFSFNPLAAAAGGFMISFVGSMVGVGGGFLVAPFMASILLFPMFLVVGTALVALMVPLTVSVLTYILLQVHVDWWLVGIEVPGIMLGSLLGPALNRRMNEKALKTFVAVMLFGIGIYYVF